MKSIKFFLKFILLYILITGCRDDNELFLYENTSQNQKTTNTYKSSIQPIKKPKRLKDELIIKFIDSENIDEAYRDSLRTVYEIISHKACNCNAKRIEKWKFKKHTFTEGRKDKIAQEGGVESADYQFHYPNENIFPPGNRISNQPITPMSPSIGSTNNTDLITIAIIDTGIDLNKLPGAKPFLYNNSAPSCNTIGEISGWDFVNDNNNPFDDNGHGTIVTSILINELKNQKVKNYQILPVKAFNKKGRGTTFDILCGYLYAVSKPEVSVINMSFGWYRHPSNILSDLIEENNTILHLTSAGNSENDNDDISHFPSSITHSNLLSIGSYHEYYNNYFTESYFSNYGRRSVDFLSKGENIYFQNNTVNGTSFATPFVAAKAMKYYMQSYGTPQDIIDKLKINAQPINNGRLLEVRFNDRVIK